MNRPEDDKEFMEVVGHLISHPRFQKLDGIVQHYHSTRWNTRLMLVTPATRLLKN